MKYPKSNYSFVGFEPSRRKNKKYDAILMNRDTGKNVRVPFGDSRYEQFRDNTGLGLFSHMDHGDNIRKRNYWDRHRREINDGIDNYTAGSFALKYLW